MLNVEAWLQPLSEAEPCGPSLEYDPGLIELEKAAREKPEEQVGKEIKPAVPPDWKTVDRLSSALLDKTHDLRVAIPLARAQLQIAGYRGFAEVLTLIRGWCEQFWPTLHPQLDPEDNNDPTLRLNLLSELKSADLLRQLRRVPLFTSRGVVVSLREIAMAKGELSPAENEKSLSQNEIDGAFHDVAESDLRQLHEALESSLTHLAAIDKRITDQVGAGTAVDFSPLTDLLQTAFQLVSDKWELRRPALEPPVNSEESMPTVAGQVAPLPRGLSGEVCSREDVVKALDKICDYYEKHEPSSPIPLLLRRAQKLSTMNFLEILQELAPSGLTEAQSVGGIPPG